MKLPDKIAGRDPRIVRDLFKAFVDAPSPLSFEDIEVGTQKYKALNADFAVAMLHLPAEEAGVLVSTLVAEGYLHPRS